MKILIVNDYARHIGGTETYMHSLKEGLEDAGHEVRVYASTKDKNAYIKSQKDKSFSRYMKKIFNPASLIEFRRIIKEYQPDIIHLHNIYNELSPSILLAVRDIPVVMTVHDSLIINPVSILSERTGKNCKKRTCGGCVNCVGWKGAIYERIKRSIHRILLKKIRLYITPSQYMNDFISEAGFRPTITIPNGIKLYKYSEITNFHTLLYVGRLAREKGVEYLLRAMPEVIKAIPRVRLLLVGDGPDRDYFEKIAEELGIMKNTKFVGSVEKEGIEKYYKESTIVIVPSIYPDNFPTVCIEALSVGRPIIGTNVGGISEIIKKGVTGNIIPSKSNSKIIQAILEILTNKDKLQIISSATHKRSDAFNLKYHIIKINSIYKELLR